MIDRETAIALAKEVGFSMESDFEKIITDDLTKLCNLAVAHSRKDAEAVAWRDVVGYEDIYEVSSAGDIRNKVTERLMAKNFTGAGYVKADLWMDGKKKQTTVHRVVAEAFLGDLSGKEVNHIDGCKTNNAASNLEIVSRSENERHSRDVLGSLCKPVIGTDMLTGSEIAFNSIEATAGGGFIPSNVYAVCYGKRKFHKGMYWRFENTSDADGGKKIKTHPPEADKLLHQALEALVENSDLVRNEYDDAVKLYKGMPTREARLNSMLAELEKYNNTIAAIRTYLEGKK